MHKVIRFSVVPRGKGEEARDCEERKQKVYDRYGFPRKVWRVQWRTGGQKLVEYGPFESQEALLAAYAEVAADKEYQAISQEEQDIGVEVEGRGEGGR